MDKKTLESIKSLLTQLLSLAESHESGEIKILGRVILSKNEELKLYFPIKAIQIELFVDKIIYYATDPNRSPTLLAEAAEIKAQIFQIDKPKGITEEQVKVLKKQAYELLKKMYLIAVDDKLSIDERIKVLKDIGKHEFEPVHFQFSREADDYDCARNNIGFIPEYQNKYGQKTHAEEYMAKIKKQLEEEGII